MSLNTAETSCNFAANHVIQQNHVKNESMLSTNVVSIRRTPPSMWYLL